VVAETEAGTGEGEAEMGGLEAKAGGAATGAAQAAAVGGMGARARAAVAAAAAEGEEVGVPEEQCSSGPSSRSIRQPCRRRCTSIDTSARQPQTRGTPASEARAA